MKGLELSRLCYEQSGRPALEAQFPELFPRMAAGLAGEGSECFGFDDAFSRDHDWGPGFCLWLNRPDYLAFGPRVQELYDALSSEWETRYEALKDTLPVLSPEKLYLSDLICAAHVLWQEELAEQYPRLTGHGRPIRKENDGPGITSFETYLRGELLTYSVESLRLYAAFVDKSKKERVNLCEQVLRNTVQRYGYPDLETAEEHPAKGA